MLRAGPLGLVASVVPLAPFVAVLVVLLWRLPLKRVLAPELLVVPLVALALAVAPFLVARRAPKVAGVDP